MEATAAELTNEVSTFLTALSVWAADALPRLISALLLLAAGWWIAGRAESAMIALLSRQSHIERTLCGVIASLVRYGILTLFIVAVLGQLGIQTTSIIAALGAVGLAIGLAMQGTLSNIAAGLMLLWLRPFRVGDYIDTGSVTGTVTDVGLFACELQSYDGLYLFVPNSELWNKRITNFTRRPTRMADLSFGIAYEDDVAKGKEVLLKAARDDERALSDPEPIVFVDQLGDSAVVLRLRVWTQTTNYLSVYRDMTEKGKQVLEAAGLSIPFPQRDLHIKDAPPALTGNGAGASPQRRDSSASAA
ncbi:MAG: mechanosensitive ion channel family protein [Xanthobacteraceae bacterium]|uniref:mechanosensitive ion channel family protein n=1 Tax=Pseudolabrys sp. TaxID=1960880 RepID=UPI003D0C0E84